MKNKKKQCYICSKELAFGENQVLSIFEAKEVNYCPSCYSDLKVKKKNEFAPSKKEELKLDPAVILSIFMVIFCLFSNDLLMHTWLIIIFWAVSIDLHGWIEGHVIHKNTVATKEHYKKFGHYNMKLHAFDPRSSEERYQDILLLEDVSSLRMIMKLESSEIELSKMGHLKIELKYFFTHGVFKSRVFLIPFYTVLYFIAFYIYITICGIISLEVITRYH